MKPHHTIAVSVLVGVAVGVAAVQTLRAQAKPPAFVVGEIVVTNPDAYQTEYVPPAVKAIVDGGGKYIVRGGEIAGMYGEPPKPIAIVASEALDKAQAAFDSPAYKDAKKAGDKYANFRIYAVEGLPQ
ncbi:MAG: DUF1330 domain-containing protein [Reyranellales bacterium]